ncbi:MAG TPA: cytidine deaminase [Thermotogota bacterium]|nr:cytidine deaminase [Thermotogota bacterium]HPJ89550.1 cytidine deaminase [Thermotogota bacterium]
MIKVTNEKELINKAIKQLDNSYSPFSKFRVGAALLGKSGKIYTGSNVENSSYGLTICAERAACVKAVSDGEREFEGIVVATETDEPGTPCGACRQFLWEFGDMEVVLVNPKGAIKRQMLSELLPGGFRL